MEAYDEEGRKAWERELDIYGRVKPEAKDIYGRAGREEGEQNFIPFRFQGQYEDEETGLYYNRFRYYSPDDGCYTQQDPIGLAGGNPTIYGYVLNSNIYIDPFGLATRPNNGMYHVFFKHDLKQKLWTASDKIQFKDANVEFIKIMEKDPSFRKNMLKRFPKLADWLKKPAMRNSPGGQGVLTWHHNASEGGRLELVDFTDHKKNHGLYHPNNKGGRHNWGGGSSCR